MGLLAGEIIVRSGGLDKALFVAVEGGFLDVAQEGGEIGIAHGRLELGIEGMDIVVGVRDIGGVVEDALCILATDCELVGVEDEMRVLEVDEIRRKQSELGVSMGVEIVGAEEECCLLAGEAVVTDGALDEPLFAATETFFGKFEEKTVELAGRHHTPVRRVVGGVGLRSVGGALGERAVGFEDALGFSNAVGEESEHLVGIAHIDDGRGDDAQQAEAFFGEGCHAEKGGTLLAGEGGVAHEKADGFFAIAEEGLRAEVV